MKLVIQRVKKAKVTVQETGLVSGEINQGLFILFGVGKGDTSQEVETLAEKVLKLRIMSDPPSPEATDGQVKKDKMNLSIKDIKGEILVVSQFTLYADTTQGNRPSFINAAEPKVARDLYELFIEKLKSSGLKVETGSFGNYMEIETICDGPVTIIY